MRAPHYSAPYIHVSTPHAAILHTFIFPYQQVWVILFSDVVLITQRRRGTVLICLEPAIPLNTLRVDDFNCTEGTSFNILDIQLVFRMSSFVSRTSSFVSRMSSFVFRSFSLFRTPIYNFQDNILCFIYLCVLLPSFPDTEFQITNTEGVSYKKN